MLRRMAASSCLACCSARSLCDTDSDSADSARATAVGVMCVCRPRGPRTNSVAPAASPPASQLKAGGNPLAAASLHGEVPPSTTMSPPLWALAVSVPCRLSLVPDCGTPAARGHDSTDTVGGMLRCTVPTSAAITARATASCEGWGGTFARHASPTAVATEPLVIAASMALQCLADSCSASVSACEAFHTRRPRAMAPPIPPFTPAGMACRSCE